jgi:hypothetical protein
MKPDGSRSIAFGFLHDLHQDEIRPNVVEVAESIDSEETERLYQTTSEENGQEVLDVACNFCEMVLIGSAERGDCATGSLTWSGDVHLARFVSYSSREEPVPP